MPKFHVLIILHQVFRAQNENEWNITMMLSIDQIILSIEFRLAVYGPIIASA